MGNSHAGAAHTGVYPNVFVKAGISRRAVDARELKATPRRGVSPEVFAAWCTGYDKIVRAVLAVSGQG